jgi:enoyl-[acyl-carrier-protein] reductase (NADH)
MFCITGKRAFIAGVADDQGFGWAIAKALSAAGAEILLGTWVPVHSPISVLCHFPSSKAMQLSKKISFYNSHYGG